MTSTKKMSYGLAMALVCAMAPQSVPGSSFAALVDARLPAGSTAIVRGTVVKSRAYEDPADGHIYTESRIRVEEVFKGKAPLYIMLVQRGGSTSERGETDGESVRLCTGEERLLFLSRDQHGRLYVAGGPAGAPILSAAKSRGARAPQPHAEGVLQALRAQTAEGPLPGEDLTGEASAADVSDSPPITNGPEGPVPNASSTATNLLSGADGIAPRFVASDRGEGIPYLVDVDYLPTGITQSQALDALEKALDAWAQVTSMRFRFAGITSFGMASKDVQASDEVLRVQLHDHYGATAGGNELGRGGLTWTTQVLDVGWTTGGNVKGNDFHKATSGFVMLQHTNNSMRTLTLFTEVLTHEIGHAIGLAHSSENSNEPNSAARQAIMYYTAHGDGRGAKLNSFDVAVSQQGYPQSNTPPFCTSRVIDAITTPDPINIAGVNSVQLRGYDLQGQVLNIQTTEATTNNGTFLAADSIIRFTPYFFFSDSQRLDPASGMYFDKIHARYSDGLNASPFVSVRVISFNADTYSEGIPDKWRLQQFGDEDPNAGPKRHANDDYDGDGYPNIQEYRLGSDPRDASSNLRMILAGGDVLWTAKSYEAYELKGTTNFLNWAWALPPIVPTNTLARTPLPRNAPNQFFRLEKVP